MAPKELRRHPRRPIQELVPITWEEPNSGQRGARVRCTDISESGMRVEVERPLPLRTMVKVDARKLGLIGMASVRYCRQGKNFKYIVGLEFTGGMVWRPTD
ncbi:MAG: PilZ domain-containing protein [Bryobacteraceae bacterium]